MSMFSATVTGDCKVPMSLCWAVQICSGGGGACQTKLSAVPGLSMYYVDDTHMKYEGHTSKSDQNVLLSKTI